MNFSEILEEVKNGSKCCRDGWNGKDMFIYMVDGSQVWKDTLKPNSEMEKHVSPADKSDTIFIRAHIDMRGADGLVTIGWNPSQPDLFAEDWEVCE